jgi:hypothetical protein
VRRNTRLLLKENHCRGEQERKSRAAGGFLWRGIGPGQQCNPTRSDTLRNRYRNLYYDSNEFIVSCQVKRRNSRFFCADRARYRSAHRFAKKFLSTSKRVRKSCSSKVSSGLKRKHIWARCQVLLQETHLTIRLKLTIVVREVPIMISEILYCIRCDQNGFPVRVSLEKRSTRVLSIDCTEQLHHLFHSLQGSRDLTCKES